MSIDYTKQRNWGNSYLDYTPETTRYVSFSEINSELIDRVNKTEINLIRKLSEYYDSLLPNSRYDVYVGTCGLALVFLMKYNKTGDKVFLEKAKKIVDNALLNLKNYGISFLQGDAGPLALGIIIYYKLNDDRTKLDLVNRLLALCEKDSTGPAYELLNGRAGYLYALLLVKRIVGNVIPEATIRETINIIIEAGAKKAEISRFKAPLKYEWYSTNYLGAAHGVAGILYVLLSTEMLTEHEKNDYIKPTIDWLLTQRFPSGNFQSSEGKDRDTLVQWCHGAPGFVHMLLLASDVFQSNHYKEIALQCGDLVWERGLLTKGYSICHGVSGNAYTFIEIYKATKIVKHLHRAACFAHWCTKYPENECMKPDRPFSLFEGLAGLVYFLNDVKTPLASVFPAYGLQ